MGKFSFFQTGYLILSKETSMSYYCCIAMTMINYANT